MVEEGAMLWEPSRAFAEEANITAFRRWLNDRGHALADYQALWRWSVADIDGFWAAIWTYFEILSDTPYEAVRTGSDMLHTQWFPGSRVNYAEHLLRHESAAAPGEVAMHHSSETRAPATMTWSELGDQVRLVATSLRALGIKPGDRVVSYMPNVPETLIAMLATVAIGAVWSSAAPEFGVKTVVDRFSQIEPKLLFAADGYMFGGKRFDRRAEVDAIAAALPSLEQIVWLPYLDSEGGLLASGRAVRQWDDLLEGKVPTRDAFRFERVAHDHPLWILFSSGTTGLPKAIVHSHVGMVVEHLKIMVLHIDMKPGDVMFFYSTTGWMMWNSVVSALIAGSAAVLYDGSPVYPDVTLLWTIAERTGATVFGASPTLVKMMEKEGVVPRERFDLSHLQMLLLGGAPSTPETFAWAYDNVRKDLWVASHSGGTELCSGLVVSVASQPVYAGEIQARALGIDVDSWDEKGKPVRNEVGELVVKQPFPAMPLYLWNDTDKRRYAETYFETFPGVWRHGDLFKLNDRGGCYIYGRADATLNRYGVRIGSAEIYRTIEQVDAIEDSLIVCIEYADGSFFMPLFIKVKSGHVFDKAIEQQIISALRRDNSPRHVPDMIVEAPGIPYTLTGKRMEVPVRKILAGLPPEKAASRDVMANPDLLAWYADFAASHKRQVLHASA